MAFFNIKAMQNTLEFVENITVSTGQTSGQIGFTPDPGQIVGAKIFYTGLNNPGIVNAAILDTNNKELSRPQHIDNYRDRNSSYMDCKPLYADGGKKMYLSISATAAFTADFKAQLVLIYAPQQTTSNYCE